MVLFGAANQAGEDNRNVARMASLLAGLPDHVPGVTVNQLCASGLAAVTLAAQSIKAGEAELVLAGGVESMSPRALGHGETHEGIRRAPARSPTRRSAGGSPTPAS